MHHTPAFREHRPLCRGRGADREQSHCNTFVQCDCPQETISP